MQNIDQTTVNAIRVLAADQVQKANSGHPGAPMGTAPMMYELWAHSMKHNPDDPDWLNRDRFVLSGGHGSAGLYALLHLFGYGLSMDDLKDFRQLGAKTPGHPEHEQTRGVECSTGPLGSGLASAVGMALAERYQAAKLNKPGYPIVDHYTFVEVGDGDLMEGISEESMSFAGAMNLSKLIVLYDSNDITIEGSTDLTFSEDVSKRMEALGFHTWYIEDGTDLEAIFKAIEEAKEDDTAPSFITVRTKIGYGSPKEGKASAHGEPLGVENVKAFKENIGWPVEPSFYVPEEVYEHCRYETDKGRHAEQAWQSMVDEACKKYPELKEEMKEILQAEAMSDLASDESLWIRPDKPEATRNSSSRILNILKDRMDSMLGGSADLGPSNKVTLQGEPDFNKDHPEGRNLHFGIREIGMGGIVNGMALSGLRPFAGTFFVFSDYVKPTARMSALMKLPVTYVFSHDSIGVGEDGPTHQPIEQLCTFRSIPNFSVFRPADAMETTAAWITAAQSKDHPVAIITSRQNLPQLEHSGKDALKGGYILEEASDGKPELILMGSGSEVSLLVEARKMLEEQGIPTRVVSMPSMDLFMKQPKEWRQMVLPDSVRARVAVEASNDPSWYRFIGMDGRFIGMEGFGTSAPATVLFPYFGFTPENIAKTAADVHAENK